MDNYLRWSGLRAAGNSSLAVEAASPAGRKISADRVLPCTLLRQFAERPVLNQLRSLIHKTFSGLVLLPDGACNPCASSKAEPDEITWPEASIQPRE